MKKQRLAGSTSTDLIQIVRDVGGLHATHSTTPYLSLLARMPRFEKADLDSALYEQRTLGKIRCVRKTIYVHTKDMLPVAFKATLGAVVRASQRHMEFRGVSPEEYKNVSETILDLLKDKEMTASAIKAALGTKTHLSSILYFMCDQGLLIRGRPEKGWKDKNHHYALFHNYFPDTDLEKMSEAQAITALVRQYLASFGPVTENDVVWWTGLGKRKVRGALRDLKDQITQVSIVGIEGNLTMLRSDEALIRASTPPGKPTVNLLPCLDPYLMGYKERARYLDQEHYDRTFDRSGNATSTILVDGRVAGVWDFEDGKRPLVKLFLFKKIAQDALDRVLAQAQSLGVFMAGREVLVRECDAMIHLTERTAGSFMSPLKGQVCNK
ncbi:MAG: winged helix DNA-binding domain-containing protein [Anaerolineae bacterium]